MARGLKNQGILVSRKGRHAILLTNEGDFRPVKLRRSADISIGQTVLSKHLSHTFKFCRFLLKSVITVSVSFLCLLPFSQNTHVADRPVAAYLDFDLVPSIEAAVDQSLHVISVQPLNEDAKKVIPDPDFFSDMSLKEFSSVLAARLDEKGYLNNGSLYLVTTVFTGRVPRAHRDAFDADLVQEVKSASSQSIQSSGATFKWMHATPEGRSEAIKNGIPVGEYLLGRQTRSQDVNWQTGGTIPDSTRLLFTNPWSGLMKMNKSNHIQGPEIGKIFFSLPGSVSLDPDSFINGTGADSGGVICLPGNPAVQALKVPMIMQA
ncbi:anti-sigma factor domain-containing protein [Sporolactobacillus sp. KGMB 08714]|uniref:anti-sigma factor domain-containing protein n=1 Tax=Sporolactobacillus sp. KGMB 08714 TaxID=3064704 RepID=UPI002FBE3F3F